VTLHDHIDTGAYGVRLTARDVVAHHNRSAFGAGRTARLENVTASDNTVYGVAASGSIRIQSSTFTGNSWAADSRRTTVANSQVTDNSDFGVRGTKILRVVDSTITGNGFAPGPFFGGPYVDLLGGQIVLRRSTCETSFLTSGAPRGAARTDRDRASVDALSRSWRVRRRARRTPRPGLARRCAAGTPA
jgi:hypothetical protein